MGTPNLVSEASICNLALKRAGSNQQIGALTDQTNEASTCALFYPQDRDAILNDFPFPWSEVYFLLTQVAGPETTNSRANAQWLRSFRYPSDCLKLHRVVFTPTPLVGVVIPQTTGVFGINYWYNESWRRAVGDAYPVPYGLSQDSQGLLICMDMYNTQYGMTAIYTGNSTNPAVFHADFIDHLAWRLGGDLAMALSYDVKKREYCMKMAEETKCKVRAASFNEMQSDIPYLRHQAETIRARWGG